MPIEETPHAKPSGFLTFVWALFFLVVFALIVYIWIQKSGPTRDIEDKRATARYSKRAELQKSDEEKLGSVGWVDKPKGIVRLPIADARRLVVDDLRARKPVASQIKVEPSLPMPAPFDPNAAEPAPPALPSAPQGADTVRFDPANTAAAPAASPANVSASTDIKK